MSEWWTYSLTDFLLFSPRTYYRLFQLYNEAVWPAHIAAFALGLAILISILRADGRAAAAILSVVWLWVAVAFHLERYATINWAALYVAPLFALQAALLLWTGVAHDRLAPSVVGTPARAALALYTFALFVQPMIGPLLGRSWAQAEIFGLAPDPTAIATLAVLVTASRIHWHLLLVPVLWCAFTGLTLWAMEAPDAWITPVAGALALGLAAWKTIARKT